MFREIKWILRQSGYFFDDRYEFYEEGRIMRGKKSRKSFPDSVTLAKNLRQKDRIVYRLLVGYDGQQYTKTQAANLLKIPKSTMTGIVKRLENAKAITKMGNGTICVLYKRHVNGYIVDEITKAAHDVVFPKDQVVTTPRVDSITWVRAHLNGGWITFPVEKEGCLDRLNMPGNTIALFEGVKPVETIRGVLQYSGLVRIGGKDVRIRYQKAIRPGGACTFGICPSGIPLSADQVDQFRECITD